MTEFQLTTFGIGQYYGLDYIATLTAVAGMYFLGNRSPLGFVLYLLSSLAMLGFAMIAKSPPIFFANVIMLVVTVRGLLRWRRVPDEHGG